MDADIINHEIVRLIPRNFIGIVNKITPHLFCDPRVLENYKFVPKYIETLQINAFRNIFKYVQYNYRIDKRCSKYALYDVELVDTAKDVEDEIMGVDVVYIASQSKNIPALKILFTRPVIVYSELMLQDYITFTDKKMLFAFDVLTHHYTTDSTLFNYSIFNLKDIKFIKLLLCKNYVPEIDDARNFLKNNHSKKLSNLFLNDRRLHFTEEERLQYISASILLKLNDIKTKY